MTDRTPDGMRGRRLRPFRRHHVLHRQLFTTVVKEPDGNTVRYTVEHDLGRDDGRIVLYTGEHESATAEPPASFPVPCGVIEVNASLYGVTRVHLVRTDGVEQRLTPVAGALLANLVLAVPQVIELVTTIPKLADAVGGTFTSPVQLPLWLNVALTLAGALAAVERLLMLRRHRVLDIETLWTNF